MTIPLKKLTREQVLGIRERYADGVAVTEIQNEFDVSWHTVDACVRGGPKIGGKRMFDPLPLRKTLKGRKLWPAKPEVHLARRANLVRHLWQTAEAQVIAIEARASLDTTASAERDARAFAVLVKTLQDLIGMDGKKAGGKGDGNKDGDDAAVEVNYDDPGQVDDFRRELARRIAAIATGPAAGPDREP